MPLVFKLGSTDCCIRRGQMEVDWYIFMGWILPFLPNLTVSFHASPSMISVREWWLKMLRWLGLGFWFTCTCRKTGFSQTFQILDFHLRETWHKVGLEITISFLEVESVIHLNWVAMLGFRMSKGSFSGTWWVFSSSNQGCYINC